MYVKRLLICIALLVSFSCSEKNEVYSLINLHKYDLAKVEVEKVNPQWLRKIITNKINIDLNEELIYSFEEIYQDIKADQNFDYISFHQVYSRFKIRQFAFVQMLFEIEDRMKLLKRADYHYDELLSMFLSKRKAVQDYAIYRLTSNFDYSYNIYFFDYAYKIMKEESFTEAYKLEIKKLASFLDRYYKDSSLYDEQYLSYPYEIEEISTALFQRKYENNSLESIKIGQFKSADFFLLPDSVIRNYSDSIILNKNIAYAYFLSNKKVRFENYSMIDSILNSKIFEDNFKNYLLRKIDFKDKDSLHIYLAKDIPVFAKTIILQHIEKYDNDIKYMESYFAAFKHAKMQRNLEERIVKLDKDYLREFLSNKLSSSQENDQTFSMYLIGKLKFKEFIDRITIKSKSDNYNIKFEAEQTLKRLKL